MNYYRFSAYGLTLKQKGKTDIYQDGVTFRQMKAIYNFDKRLRELLIYHLESVEIEFRTKIAYYHAHEFGALSYLKSENFDKEWAHKKFLNDLERDIDRAGEELFVMHHKSKYSGEFPFWVAIEVISFGELSKLFRNLLKKVRTRLLGTLVFVLIMWLPGYTPCPTSEIYVHTMGDCMEKN